MSDKDVQVEFSAKIDQLKAAMVESAASVKGSVDAMKGHFDTLGSVFGSLGKAMGTVGAILAGGAMFKAAVEATKEFTGEATKLGKQLGITASEASTLNIALGDIGSDSDTYGQAATKLTRQLRTNEQGLKDMGVETRKSNGEFKNGQELMESALNVLRGYKEGVDRNMAAMDMFGPRVGDVNKLLKMNKEVMEEARKKQEELGLMVGVEGVENTKAYKKSMNDVGDVLLGIKNAIGSTVMPVLTQLGNWFSTIGPATVTVVKVAIQTLVIAFYGLVNGIKIVMAVATALGETMNAVVTGIAGAWSALQNLDPKGAADAMTGIADKVEAAWVKAGQNMVKSSVETNNAVEKLLAKPTEIKATESKGKSWTPMKQKPEKDTAAARLALAKAISEAENAILQDNLKRAQSLYDEAYSENLMTVEEYYAAKLRISTTGLDKEIEMKRKEITAAQAEEAKSQAKGTPEGDKEVLKFKTEVVKLTADLQIKEAARAEAEINNTHRMLQEARKKSEELRTMDIADREAALLGGIEVDRIAAQEKLDLGLITKAQMLEQELQFEERSNTIKRNALQERIDMALGDPTTDPKALAALYAQLEQLTLQHNLKMQTTNSQLRLEMSKGWKSVADTMESSLSGAMTSILTRTATLRQALLQMFNAIGTAMITELVTKPLAAKAAAWLSDKLFGISEVSKNAAVAGSGAAAAVAGIPIVGPAMAAVAGPAVFAETMGFGAAIMAEQGYDIPKGMNPTVQLHQEEMVLPAKHADVIRNMAETGGGRSGGDMHFNVSAIDAKGVKQFFDEHAGTLVKQLRKSQRSFQLG